MKTKFFIAVGTPPGEDGSADLQYVLQVAEEIGQNINEYAVIVNKSTVPVGTADKVRQAVQAELDKRGKDIEFEVQQVPQTEETPFYPRSPYAAAKELGMAIRWEGRGVEEKGINIANDKIIVSKDPSYFRPTEVETLLGDPSKARKKLGWVPETSIETIIT